jgi:hypothetical protein
VKSTRARYVVGALIVAAAYAVASNWNRIRPAPEEPAPSAGGGVLDMHQEETQKAIEFMNQQSPKPPPATR